MADLDWHYLENQFDNSTRNSFKRAHQQGTFHNNALPNAPGAILGDLLARHTAAWTPFANGYALWMAKRGQRKGATKAFEDGLDQLSATDIEAIETNFKTGYGRGTPEHTGAFPLGREPFQQGGANDRINALSTLLGACGLASAALTALLTAATGAGAPQPELDALNLRVLSMAAAGSRTQGVRDALQGLNTLQDDLETETDLARTALEPLRVTWADAIFGNLGQLMSAYATGVERPSVAAYFDLDILRQTGPAEEDPPVVPPVP